MKLSARSPARFPRTRTASAHAIGARGFIGPPARETLALSGVPLLPCLASGPRPTRALFVSDVDRRCPALCLSCVLCPRRIHALAHTRAPFLLPTSTRSSIPSCRQDESKRSTRLPPRLFAPAFSLAFILLFPFSRPPLQARYLAYSATRYDGPRYPSLPPPLKNLSLFPQHRASLALRSFGIYALIARIHSPRPSSSFAPELRPQGRGSHSFVSFAPASRRQPWV